MVRTFDLCRDFFVRNVVLVEAPPGLKVCSRDTDPGWSWRRVEAVTTAISKRRKCAATLSALRVLDHPPVAQTFQHRGARPGAFGGPVTGVAGADVGVVGGEQRGDAHAHPPLDRLGRRQVEGDDKVRRRAQHFSEL